MPRVLAGSQLQVCGVAEVWKTLHASIKRSRGASHGTSFKGELLSVHTMQTTNVGQHRWNLSLTLNRTGSKQTPTKTESEGDCAVVIRHDSKIVWILLART
eukprot:1981260-Amphidinium_carterae.2